MSVLSIRAGKNAFQRIQESGLTCDDVGAVFGASGAAKWLTISALDGAIFGDWLIHASAPIHLFGTSVGAWKLAAAAQNNPKQALSSFANAYCQQRYGLKITHHHIQIETQKIIDSILSPDQVQQVLSNPKYRFHCGAVKCRGWLASESKPALALAMALASGLNVLERQQLKRLVERVVFFDQRSPPPLQIDDSLPTQQIELKPNNFVSAITASGSIPYVMRGVANVEGAPEGMYRDGGLIDYHPTPNNLWRKDDLVLYPHFYSHIIPGWFDKFLPWRKATAEQLSNVVLISPSAEYVASLPNQRIPDRQDFVRYKGHNEDRIELWKHCINRGQDLAKEFLETVNSSKLQHVVRPL